MPAWLGWIAVVLLSLYLAVYPALAAGLGWRLRRRAGRCALLLALGGAWAMTEWLRGTMFTGFPWNPVGGGAGPTLRCSHSSALIGTYGLSVLVVLLGGALWLEYPPQAGCRVGDHPRRRLPAVGCCRRRAVPDDPSPIRQRARSSSPTSASRTNGGRASPTKRRGGWRRLVGGAAERRAAAAALARSGGHRAARGRAHRRASGVRRSSSAPARPRCSAPATRC